MGRVAAFFCVAALSLSGCGKRDVAVVNSERVTRAAFVKQLEADYGHEVLSRMTDRLLVDQAFVKAGMEFPQEKLESIVQEWRDQAGSEEEFQRQLTMQGRTEQDLREAIEMGIKIEMLCQKDLSYTEADLKKYYEGSPLRYDETKPDAKFPDLAKEYSISPSRAGGGQLPPMTREDIIPVEARDIAFALSEGEVSKPFKAAEQWIIIKLNEHRKAKKLTFAEAREKVEEDYKREKMVQPADLIQDLRNNADVRILDPQFADLQPLYMGSRLLDQAPGVPGVEGTEPPAGAPEPPSEGPPPIPSPPPAEQPETGEKDGP
jgi:foldase protein PrsA